MIDPRWLLLLSLAGTGLLVVSSSLSLVSALRLNRGRSADPVLYLVFCVWLLSLVTLALIAYLLLAGPYRQRGGA